MLLASQNIIHQKTLCFNHTMLLEAGMYGVGGGNMLYEYKAPAQSGELWLNWIMINRT